MNLRVSFFCAIFLCSMTSSAQNPAATASVTPQGVTSTQSVDVLEFQKVEDTWSDAVNRRDQYALELSLSPLFVDIAASGDVTTRNQQVAYLLSGDDKSLSLDQKVITVRKIGTVAIVNGTYSLRHKAAQAQVEDKGVFTHVFQHVQNGWQCVNSQRTLIRTDSNAKQKKPSNAEMPFHIPLLSK